MHVSNYVINVCVKVQDGIQTNLAQFPTANLISVPLSLGEEDEYDYPDSLRNESRKPCSSTYRPRAEMCQNISN
ncbi:hypothetical protein DPMN_054781 [Dreissena polymorpha]|uniref:Uncharacterized protein n=1 Tax=Dreissena polymorpha TaxID=45954 RepID=A0A9D4CQB8_DREPO|nr:hypothetical protein DPMN_054781 [Dreissena polymorpha]